ncbi:MAG TPA: phenylalanine--tRNA ligase beta subunit-related protein, partial [Ideonella sp.]|nr:phenylalanine--tRNA ligase beta subunit-related protein [Ideonella sp.]
ATRFKTAVSKAGDDRRMHFSHHPDLWQAYPQLVAGVARVEGVDGLGDTAPAAEAHLAATRQRLEAALGNESAEGSWPEIQAWRRVFSQMGEKPTQVRCAAEALLRRLRKEGTLPRLHPLIDLCNALSVRFAVPVAVFDMAEVAWPMQVRHATGDERYLSFGGEVEQPQPREIIFADAAGQAHARRWAHRQSGASAIRAQTRSALIVAEAHHATAAESIEALLTQLEHDLRLAGCAGVASATLSAERAVFTLAEM